MAVNNPQFQINVRKNLNLRDHGVGSGVIIFQFLNNSKRNARQPGQLSDLSR